MFPAIVAGATALGGTIFNGVSTSVNNKKSRKWLEEQYAKTRKDAISDWNMQNAYNSPEQAMQRYKEAGLNPNMIYGHGTDAGPAGPVRAGTTGSWNPEPPKIDTASINSSIFASQDYSLKQVQTDNVKESIKTAQAQQSYIAANTVKTLAETDLKNFSLEQQKKLQDTLDYNLSKAKLELQGMEIANTTRMDANDRANIMMQPTLEKMAETILSIKAQRTMIPWQKELIQEQISNLKTNQSFTELRKMSERQQQQMRDILMQSELMKQSMMGKQMQGVELDNELKRIKSQFKGMGLSESATSDLINLITKFLK